MDIADVPGCDRRVSYAPSLPYFVQSCCAAKTGPLVYLLTAPPRRQSGSLVKRCPEPVAREDRFTLVHILERMQYTVGM